MPPTGQSCNRSEPPQLPKGLFSRLKQKYLANSTKPGKIFFEFSIQVLLIVIQTEPFELQVVFKVEATRNPVENGIVDQIPPKSEDGELSASSC